MILNICAVAAGGALGATCRYLTGVIVSHFGSTLQIFGAFPLATFLANVIGCFLIGILSVCFESGPLQGKGAWRLFAITGIMGGFTTFSTFSLETVTLFDNGAWGMGFLNVAVSLGACLAGVVAGRMLAMHLFGGRA